MVNLVVELMQKMVVLLSMFSVHSPILTSYCLNGVLSRFQVLFWHSIHFAFFFTLCKVNSLQEACAKCFAAHMVKFEIMQITLKK